MRVPARTCFCWAAVRSLQRFPVLHFVAATSRQHRPHSSSPVPGSPERVLRCFCRLLLTSKVYGTEGYVPRSCADSRRWLRRNGVLRSDNASLLTSPGGSTAAECASGRGRAWDHAPGGQWCGLLASGAEPEARSRCRRCMVAPSRFWSVLCRSGSHAVMSLYSQRALHRPSVARMSLAATSDSNAPQGAQRPLDRCSRGCRLCGRILARTRVCCGAASHRSQRIPLRAAPAQLRPCARVHRRGL
jgi:hypothetical protein